MIIEAKVPIDAKLSIEDLFDIACRLSDYNPRMRASYSGALRGVLTPAYLVFSRECNDRGAPNMAQALRERYPCLVITLFEEFKEQSEKDALEQKLDAALKHIGELKTEIRLIYSHSRRLINLSLMEPFVGRK